MISIFLFLLSLSSFSFQKFTTTEMRENTIRINALEITEADISFVAKPKMTIVLDDKVLNFDSNKWNIKDEYVANLEKLKNFVEENDYMLIIEGHTDSQGSDKYNLALSLKRAESTKNKLLDLGISKERIISVVGKGEEMPVSTNKTREGRALNRRVEFHLEKAKIKERVL